MVSHRIIPPPPKKKKKKKKQKKNRIDVLKLFKMCIVNIFPQPSFSVQLSGKCVL